MSRSYFDSLVKKAENVDAKKADDDFGNAVVWTDTGSYAFNGLISGTIYGGIASGKIFCLAGEESTGKTFYALEIVKNFLDANPEGAAFYFESEEALTKQIIEAKGIDSNRLYVLPSPTVQSFRTQCLRVLNEYMETPKDDRKPLLMVLDSMGNLSTDKELTDIAEASDKRDMTRAQLLRGTFRALTIKLGQANVPMILTNHVYSVIGAYIPTKEMGGGAGAKYAASTIVFLSKSKAKEKGDDDKKTTVGAIIKIKTQKSRFTREDKQVATLLDHSKGLNRYYGLLDIGAAGGLFEQVTKEKFKFPNGKTAYNHVIYENPTDWFTKDILDQLDVIVGKIFKYGGENNDLLDTSED